MWLVISLAVPILLCNCALDGTLIRLKLIFHKPAISTSVVKTYETVKGAQISNFDFVISLNNSEVKVGVFKLRTKFNQILKKFENLSKPLATSLSHGYLVHAVRVYSKSCAIVAPGKLKNNLR